MNNLKFKSFLGLLAVLTILSPTCQATIFCKMDSTSLIKCSLSSHHHNRIALSNGRIKKIIFPEKDISIRLEEDSGQIFVDALNLYNTRPITISIVSEEGEIQDLEINFEEKSSEILILNNELEEPICAPKEPCLRDITEVLKEILNGRTPEGYVSYDDPSYTCNIKKCFKAKVKAKFVGPNDTIYLWEIQNFSSFSQSINEIDLTFENTLWVYMGKTRLDKREKMVAITAQNL